MNSLSSVHEAESQLLSRDDASHDTHDHVLYPTSDARMAAQLRSAHLREAALLQEHLQEAKMLQDKANQDQRQAILSQEFEHRLINGLQLISSLLSLQSRSATTPETAAQLTIAANRITALGRVHHHLHVLDHQDRVEFKPYLQGLCSDLADLLLRSTAAPSVRIECVEAELPSVYAIPLGFIVSELMTNSAKHGGGGVTVKFETAPPDGHSLSVADEGPGLPDGFDPTRGNGLGMKIVTALVGQIHGKLHIEPGDNGSGTRFRITFLSAKTGNNGT